MVATDAFLARARSLIVDASSLPDRAIEPELGDNLLGDLGSSVSICIGLGRCNFFSVTSLSGTGGGGSEVRTFAVLVEVVERMEFAERPLRGGGFSSGAGRVTFLEREGVV